MTSDRGSADVDRIRQALAVVREEIRRLLKGKIRVSKKSGGDPVTEVDLAVGELLRKKLPSKGEGWLSEESADGPARLRCSRVWIVDPLDGTREFVEGIPEWCVSVGLVEDGRPVAGGILNPATDELIVGSRNSGVTRNGRAVRVRSRAALKGALVLASRSEWKRGEWEEFRGRSYRVRPMGSVAYKLARVAAGLADATWTLTPKHEWDVAAGVALIAAGGGTVWVPGGKAPRFNLRDPLLPGLVATSAALAPATRRLLKLAGTGGGR